MGSNLMGVLSLKYQICVLVDPVKYNTFDIRGVRGLETMVQTHIYSGSPYFELYAKFARAEEDPWRLTYVPVREARMEEQAKSPTTQLCVGFTALLESSHSDILESSMGRHSSISALDFICGRESTKQLGFGGDFGYFDNDKRKDDVLPTTSIDEGTFNPRDVGGVENEDGIEFDTDPIQEPATDGSKFALFSELQPVLTEPEDGGSDDKGPGEDAEENP
ncbi:hypothetical protein J1N35_004816 [Gossypium stocksii]|uniref:Uncharacterized protein n=1 Tax=Gossypium stocksii TaxID=47602 RepID=A0A9D4AIN6_9ROSI|nr:hypothetical protein J1N35_004816 [Gossypium stocksii]